MFANQSEAHDMPEADDLEYYEAQTEEDALELYGDDEPEGGDELPVAAHEDNDEARPESSLDELLARRAAKAALEGEEDGLADLISLLDDAPGGLQVKTPPATRSEFVCSRCRLVKPRVQLSDATRLLCRDCA
ncbi:MAG: DUF4193 family protein [Actinomycetota bacterium]|nr:DUF4193 family protein [Actinomycetota bacterium]